MSADEQAAISARGIRLKSFDKISFGQKQYAVLRLAAAARAADGGVASPKREVVQSGHVQGRRGRRTRNGVIVDPDGGPRPTGIKDRRREVTDCQRGATRADDVDVSETIHCGAR